MATTHDLLPYDGPGADRPEPTPHHPQVGARCGLVAGADPDRRVLRVLGFGRCQGVGIPPAHAGGTISAQYRRERVRIPFFLLEDGQSTVWGSECRWLEPERYERYTDTLRLVGYQVEEVAIAQLRSELGAADTWDDLPGAV